MFVKSFCVSVVTPNYNKADKALESKEKLLYSENRLRKDWLGARKSAVPHELPPKTSQDLAEMDSWRTGGVQKEQVWYLPVWGRKTQGFISKSV